MIKEDAYKILAKHIFNAHLKYEADKDMIILADNLDEAERKVKAFFGTSSIIVQHIIPTNDPQVYKIKEAQKNEFDK